LPGNKNENSPFGTWKGQEAYFVNKRANVSRKLKGQICEVPGKRWGDSGESSIMKYPAKRRNKKEEKGGRALGSKEGEKKFLSTYTAKPAVKPGTTRRGDKVSINRVKWDPFRGRWGRHRGVQKNWAFRGRGDCIE